MGGDRGNGGGRGPGPPPGKLQVVIYFQVEKLVRASLEKQQHSFLVGVRRCLDCLGLSLHPLKNFSEQRDPAKIAQKRRLS